MTYALSNSLEYLKSELYYMLKHLYEFFKAFPFLSEEVFIINLDRQVKSVIEQDGILFAYIAENDYIYRNIVYIKYYESQEHLINFIISEFNNEIKDPEKIYLEHNMHMKYYVLMLLTNYMNQEEFNQEFCFLLKKTHDFDASTEFLESKLIYEMKKYELIQKF